VADSNPLSAADWLRARRSLAVQLAILTVTGASLADVSQRIDAAALDARLLYVVVLALFSATLLHGVLRALELVEWDCPRCHENYCGGPLLFRARCNSCGHAAGTDARRHPSRER
jgi:hypothetical protein